MKYLLLAALGLYLAYAAAMIWLHPRFVYPFQPDDRVLDGFERVQLQGADGTPIFVQVRQGAGPVLLYFMGNAGALPFFESAFPQHIAADRHIIALEYRGGGGRPGTQSEAVLKSDALIATDYALELNRPVIAQGYSLGSGLAAYVTAERGLDGAILVAPYDRLCRLLTLRSYLPACILPFVQKWNSIEDARRIAAPIHVLHGSADALIPPSYSESFTALPNVTRNLIEGAGHTDIGEFPAYREALTDAFKQIAR